LLSADDAGRIVPGAAQGVSNDTSSEYVFSVSCSWSNGGSHLDLEVLGVLKEEALTSVIGADPGANRGSWAAVDGLGDAAGYYDSRPQLQYCGIVADWHSYSVDLSATSPDPVPAQTFVPLVRKVLGQLR
jgi:hypothetical protein